MPALTVCSDFGDQENEVFHCFPCFPIDMPRNDGTGCHDLKFFECWVLSQVFHSPLSLSSRSSSVPLHFLPQGWCHVHIWRWYFSGNLDSNLRFFQLAFYMMYSAYKLNVTIYSLVHSFPNVESISCSMSGSNYCFLSTTLFASWETCLQLWFMWTVWLGKIFNLCLNFGTRSSWSEPQSAPSLVFADCIELLHLQLQKIYNLSDFSIDHLLMSMWRLVFCVVGRGCLLWPVSSLGKTLLAFVFCFSSRSNLSVTSGISWLPTFACQLPIKKRISFSGVSSRRPCRSS